MKSFNRILSILNGVFPATKTCLILKYYTELIGKYHDSDWEECISLSGKFVEAVMKCFLLYCKYSLPKPRGFKVREAAIKIENSDRKYGDTVRILIPRACLFIYDVASNRGARHDPDEVYSNEMDAIVVVQLTSWIVSELVRFASLGSLPPEDAKRIVDKLMVKKYPFFEEIDDITYINLHGLSARAIGLLLLYKNYPKRIAKEDLIEMIIKNGHTKDAAVKSVYRLQKVTDENLGLMLRGIGRGEAESILEKLRQ